MWGGSRSQGTAEVAHFFYFFYWHSTGRGGGGVKDGVGGCWEPIVGDRVYRKTEGGQQAIPHIVD